MSSAQKYSADAADSLSSPLRNSASSSSANGRSGGGGNGRSTVEMGILAPSRARHNPLDPTAATGTNSANFSALNPTYINNNADTYTQANDRLGASATGGRGAGRGFTSVAAADGLAAAGNAWYDSADSGAAVGARKSACAQWLIGVRQAAFQVLFFTTYQHALHPAYAVALLLVEFLQLLDFVVRVHTFRFDAAALSWLETATSVAAFRYKELYRANAVVVIACVVIWALVAAFVLTRSAVRRGEYQAYPGLNMVVRAVFPAVGFVLYIPLINTFLSMFDCEPGVLTHASSWAGGVCASPQHIVLLVIGAPSLVATLLVAYLCVVGMQEFGGSSLSPLSLAHSRVEQAKLLIATLLCVIMGPLLRFDSSKPLLIAVILLVAWGVYLTLRLRFLPHHRFRWELAFVAAAAALAWFALLAVTAAAQDSRDNAAGITYALFWGLPFAVLAALLAAHSRRWAVAVTSPSAITSPYILELYVRFLLARLHAHLYTPSYRLRRRVSREQYGAFVRVAEETFKHALVAFMRSDVIYLFYAQFALEFRGNMHCAHRYSNRAVALTSAPDVLYMAYKISQLIEIEFQTRQENREIRSYIAYEQHTMLAAKHDGAASRGQLRFWSLLCQPKPDVTRLSQYAVSIAEHNKKALHHYKRVLEVNPNSSYCMRLYASFLLDILQDKQHAQQQLDLADYIDEHARQARAFTTNAAATSRSRKDSRLFDEQNAILVVSGDDGDLGLVHKINSRAALLFGYSQAEFSGRHASALFAEPYASLFTHYTCSYQDHGAPLDDIAECFMLCRHVTGFVFPAFVQLRKFVDNSSMRIIVLIEHVQPKDPVCLAVVQDNGIVRALSANAAVLFGVDLEAVSGGDLHMASVIPNYTQRVWRPLTATDRRAAHHNNYAIDGTLIVPTAKAKAKAAAAASEEAAAQARAAASAARAGDAARAKAKATKSALRDRKKGRSRPDRASVSFAAATKKSSRGGAGAGGSDSEAGGDSKDRKDGRRGDREETREERRERRKERARRRKRRQPSSASNSDDDETAAVAKQAAATALADANKNNSGGNGGDGNNGLNMTYTVTTDDVTVAGQELQERKRSSADKRKAVMARAFAHHMYFLGDNSSDSDSDSESVTRFAPGTNPYIRQFSLGAMLGRAGERHRNPIFGVNHLMPVAKVDYYPPARAEAWSLTAQLIRVPLVASNLVVLVILPAPRELVLPAIATLDLDRARGGVDAHGFGALAVADSHLPDGARGGMSSFMTPPRAQGAPGGSASATPLGLGAVALATGPGGSQHGSRRGLGLAGISEAEEAGAGAGAGGRNRSARNLLASLHASAHDGDGSDGSGGSEGGGAGVVDLGTAAAARAALSPASPAPADSARAVDSASDGDGNGNGTGSKNDTARSGSGSNVGDDGGNGNARSGHAVLLHGDPLSDDVPGGGNGSSSSSSSPNANGSGEIEIDPALLSAADQLPTSPRTGLGANAARGGYDDDDDDDDGGDDDGGVPIAAANANDDAAGVADSRPLRDAAADGGGGALPKSSSDSTVGLGAGAGAGKSGSTGGADAYTTGDEVSLGVAGAAALAAEHASYARSTAAQSVKLAEQKDMDVRALLRERSKSGRHLDDDDYGGDGDDDDDGDAVGEGVRISDRLRKEVMQDNEGIASGLHKFRRTFLCSVVIIIAAALALFLTTLFLLQEYESDVRFLNRVSQRNAVLAQASRAVHRLSLMQSGLLDPTAAYPYSTAASDTSASPVPLPPLQSNATFEEEMRAQLTSAVAQLVTLSQEIATVTHTSAGRLTTSVTSGSSPSTRTITAFTARTVPASLYFPTTNTIFTDLRSVLDIVTVIASSGAALAEAPLSSFVPTNEYVFFILANAISRAGVLAGQDADYDLTRDVLVTIDLLHYIIIGLVVAPLLSIFLVIVFILRPTVFEIEESKSQVILVFLDIPNNIVVQLRGIYHSRVDTFSSHAGSGGGMVQADGDDDDKNKDNDGDDANEYDDANADSKRISAGIASAGTGHGLGQSSRVAPSIAATTNADTMSTQEAIANATAAAAANNSTQQETVTFHSDKYLFLGKIVLLLILAITYFVTIYFIGIGASREYYINAPREIFYANVRQSLMAITTSQLTVLSSYNPTLGPAPVSTWPQPAEAAFVIEMGEVVHNALIYGNSTLGVIGVTTQERRGRGTGQNFLLFSNGCVPPGDMYCRSFDSAVMTSGLASAVTEFFSTAQTALKAVTTLIEAAYATLNPTAPPVTDGNFPAPVPLSDATVQSLTSPAGQVMMMSDWLELYLTASLRESADIYSDNVDSGIQSSIRTELILLIVFSLAAVLVYLVVYVPMIHTLDTQVKRTRSMLLMIPEDVLETIPAARLMLQSKQTVL